MKKYIWRKVVFRVPKYCISVNIFLSPVSL